MVQLPTASPTSLNTEAPTECTVRFVRFSPHGTTAYQRGQEAGFTLREARAIEANRQGFIVNRRDAASTMVTK